MKPGIKIQSKQSHIEKLRKRYANNKQRVMQALGLDNYTYNNFEFETGCKFLEDLYPLNDEVFSQYYKLFSTEKVVWNWWRAEWKRWENELLMHLDYNNHPLTEKIYLQEMGQMQWDVTVNHSFSENIIKHMR